MRHGTEELSCSAEQVIDLVTAVKQFHGLSSQELNKLLRDSENFTICFNEQGSSIKIDMEKLASFLPLHLIAVLITADSDDSLFKYLLCGMRLLHSLCDLAPRQNKLEQILLDDVKVSEQLLDLVIYLLIVLGGYRQENPSPSHVPLLHSALVACSLYSLTGFIASQWQDLVQILLAHPKVDLFMDVAFGAVNVTVQFLHTHLAAQHTKTHLKSSVTAEQMVNYLCHQCEASLQFLQSLCQQKMFRERLLKNKELCENGGILFLAQSILKLKVTAPFIVCPTVVASVSRLKAKVLSILLHLCEAESISYLDEVANSPGSLNLAKSVALEVFEILKTGLGEDPQQHLSAPSIRTYPMGLLKLNALRLADILSDDSNFRSYITLNFTEALTAMFSLSHGEFLSIWCSTDLPVREEDASLEYNSFAAAGWILDSLGLSKAISVESNLIPSNMPQASYAHQRASLFVKVIANLHCFVAHICEEQERNLFLHTFLECLQMDPSKSLPGFSFVSGAQKTNNVCLNLRSLLSHAESLIPNFLNDDDVQLLRIFTKQVKTLNNTAEVEENQVQTTFLDQESKYEGSISWDKFYKLSINEQHEEAQSAGACSSPLPRNQPPNLNNRSGDLKEEMSENSAFQIELQYVRRNHMDQDDDLLRLDTRENKDRSCVSRGLREIGVGVQNVETSGSDTSSTRGKNSVDPMGNGEFPKLSEPMKESEVGGVQEDEKVENVQYEEKQPRKRKRTIMNDKQISLIERALLDEPDMQRNTASIHSWADKLSLHGSEVTTSQLRNWINNRKARLARAGKDVRAPSEVGSTFSGKQGGSRQVHLHDARGSSAEGHNPPNALGPQSRMSTSTGGNSKALVEFVDIGAAEYLHCKPG
ncbi:hypothetical protein CFOL_v3_22522 [Cephalotus follicularis]|uniref:Homeobox domain-containing protein n=1 Tax=Cephalotus follicularis TaxID=3775 RepID=A0A1Q3CFR3_CEPFO|nr:hypothetical protein CFOL_v3_22522 [Cephalotus follicularis]